MLGSGSTSLLLPCGKHKSVWLGALNYHLVHVDYMSVGFMSVQSVNKNISIRHLSDKSFSYFILIRF
jgi:hypothetical protein